MPNEQHNNKSEPMLDDIQAASFLNIKVRTLRLWRKTQGLPHIKLTRKIIRYRRHDLSIWAEHRAVALSA